MNKFGTIEWQQEQLNSIMNKIRDSIELSASDKAFIEVQKEHNKKKVIYESIWKYSWYKNRITRC